MPSADFRFPVPWACILAVVMVAGHSAAAQAQIRVDGPADAIRIDVVDAPLRDVLGTLRTKFGLRYRGNDALDKMMTVKLDAPLRRVVARLLEGYDYVIAVTPGSVDVLILQQSPAANVVIPSAGSARVPTPTAPVTTSGETSPVQRD